MGYLVFAVVIMVVWPWTMLIIVPMAVLGLVYGLRLRQVWVRDGGMVHRTPRLAGKLQRTVVWWRCRGRCGHCGTRCTRRRGRDSTGQVDHVVPWSWGGETVLRNLQLLCRACNQNKGARYAG